jgi:hypothetical protein
MKASKNDNYFLPLIMPKIIPPITSTATVIKIPMPTPVLKIAPTTSHELRNAVKRITAIYLIRFEFFMVE